MVESATFNIRLNVLKLQACNHFSREAVQAMNCSGRESVIQRLILEHLLLYLQSVIQAGFGKISPSAGLLIRCVTYLPTPDSVSKIPQCLTGLECVVQKSHISRPTSTNVRCKFRDADDDQMTISPSLLTTTTTRTELRTNPIILIPGGDYRINIFATDRQKLFFSNSEGRRSNRRVFIYFLRSDHTPQQCSREYLER